MSEESKSPRGKLDKIDWIKIGKGLLVALAGCLLTYATDIITQIQSGQSLGAYTPIVVAFWSVIANMGRKWIAANRTKFNTRKLP